MNYAIIFVRDMQRSIAFYRDAFGWPVKFQSSHWSEFVTDGATVALHLSDTGATDADGADDERAGQCRPGFHVAELGEFHRRMIERGVRCIQEPHMVFGARIAKYADPDGLVISVGEARQSQHA